MAEFKKIGSGWKSKSGKGINISIHIDRIKELLDMKTNDKGYLSFFIGENLKVEGNKPTHQISVIDNSEDSGSPF